MSYMEEQQDLNYREAEQCQRQKLAEHEATEGDMEQREAEQEQAARKAKQEGNPRTIEEQIDREVELFGELVEPFGPNWQRDMMGYNKFDLVQALKNALQREQKAQATLRSQAEEIERLRAVIRAWEATETALSAEITRLKY